MTKKKFAGLLLLSTGIILAIIGFGVGIPAINKLKNEKQEVLRIPEGDNQAKDNLLVVNLPAPDSIVASPVLVRGKSYGTGEEVRLRLTDTNQGILANTKADIEKNQLNKDYNLWQTSLIFEQPRRQKGLLSAKLIDNNQVLDEVTVTVVFR